MINLSDFKEKITKIQSITDRATRTNLILDLFSYQYQNNSLYHDFCNNLGRVPQTIRSIEDIPFLPVSFFKTHQILTGNLSSTKVFESSGTSGSVNSKHFIADLTWYEHVSKLGFESIYGPLGDYAFVALLPGYLERNNSSLVHMVQHFIASSPNPLSGFYIREFNDLAIALETLIQQKKKIVLIGVSYALLDFAEMFSGMDLSSVIIMETGGMKGTRKELIRFELHQIIKDAFNVEVVHSEYGMTELLSQAYSKGNGIFLPAPTMTVLPGRITDPLLWEKFESQCVLRIIDLGNVNSCSFIATEDLGKVYEDGSFEVLGRFDQSDLRGCNLMYL